MTKEEYIDYEKRFSVAEEQFKTARHLQTLIDKLSFDGKISVIICRNGVTVLDITESSAEGQKAEMMVFAENVKALLEKEQEELLAKINI